MDYASIRKAIKLIITFPKGSYARKMDIQHVFKIISIHPSDHHNLVFKFNGLFYYDVTLPMGEGSACRIFEAFSTALQAIFDFHSVEGGLSVHYLDDFFFINITQGVSVSNTTVFVFGHRSTTSTGQENTSFTYNTFLGNNLGFP